MFKSQNGTAIRKLNSFARPVLSRIVDWGLATIRIRSPFPLCVILFKILCPKFPLPA